MLGENHIWMSRSDTRLMLRKEVMLSRTNLDWLHPSSSGNLSFSEKFVKLTGAWLLHNDIVKKTPKRKELFNCVEAVLCKCFLFSFPLSWIWKFWLCSSSVLRGFLCVLFMVFRRYWDLQYRVHWRIYFDTSHTYLLWCWPYVKPWWEDWTLGHRWQQLSHKLGALEYFSAQGWRDKVRSLLCSEMPAAVRAENTTTFTLHLSIDGAALTKQSVVHSEETSIPKLK